MTTAAPHLDAASELLAAIQHGLDEAASDPHAAARAILRAILATGLLATPSQEPRPSTAPASPIAQHSDGEAQSLRGGRHAAPASASPLMIDVVEPTLHDAVLDSTPPASPPVAVAGHTSSVLAPPIITRPASPSASPDPMAELLAPPRVSSDASSTFAPAPLPSIGLVPDLLPSFEPAANQPKRRLLGIGRARKR